MPDLDFKIEGSQAVPFAVSPLLAFKLRVSCADLEEHVRTIALRCQIQIEAARRKYTADEQEHLLDLFGEPQRWKQTLRGMLWTNVQLVVPPFKGSIAVDLQVPCSFDFNLAATKYFAALEDGEIPLLMLFSGSVFYEGHDSLLQVTQIPWDRETTCRLPVDVWRQMMNLYYPNTAWICLRRDVFDRLYLYKTRQSLPTWEQAIDSLLPPKLAEKELEPVRSAVGS